MWINQSSRSVGRAQGCSVARGWSNSKISVWDNGIRTRTSNDEQRLPFEDPNFLGKCYGRLKPGYLESTMQEGTILLRISFR